MEDVLSRQQARMPIPRRYDAVMKDLWLLQPRFEQRGGQRPFRLLSQPYFRAAYDFLLLRCESGEVDSQLGLWWDEFQDATEERRAEMLLPDEIGKKRRRRRKSGTKVQASSTS